MEKVSKVSASVNSRGIYTLYILLQDYECGYAVGNVPWIVLSEILSTVHLQVAQGYEQVAVVLIGISV